MCNLTAIQKELVNKALDHVFFYSKIPFTGQEIATQMASSNFIPERFTADILSVTPREVSAYVRELYNTGRFPSYWAAMKINGNDGPLLYFYVRKGTVARNVAEEIEINLKK